MEQIQRRLYMVTEKEFLKVLNNKDKGPKPYDTTAEVVRVEDGVAWVHIDGGVEETPAELTINAVKGDRVKVRLVGGQAFLIGNGTAPPTDDRVANNALGVATGARTVAVDAEKVANVTEQRTRPAITSMTTWYKLSNGTPDQPTEDDHEGWSEEEPEWSPESDQQLYYSVRSRTVQGVIYWTYPHVLSSYANMSILQNAILLEVGEGSTLAYIDDEYGNHLTDENGEPIYANAGSINDAYSQIRVMANEIMSEVSETYVNRGSSEIRSLSSVMRQTAEGVDIYATINGEESDTHTHIDNDSFDVVNGDETVASFGEITRFFGYDSEGEINCLFELRDFGLEITRYNFWDNEEGWVDERTSILDATRVQVHDVQWLRMIEGPQARIMWEVQSGGLIYLEDHNFWWRIEFDEDDASLLFVLCDYNNQSGATHADYYTRMKLDRDGTLHLPSGKNIVYDL